MQRFDKVMTIENNWCDRVDGDLIDGQNRRYSSLAWLLRARHLIDVDCWGEARGEAIKPGAIVEVVRHRLQ
jgi:2-oxoglutarate ferredoxin oxidoreductase subunit alpha